MRSLLLGSALASSGFAAPAPSSGPVLTAEELFYPAGIGFTQLAPDGRHVAAIDTDDDDRHHLLIVDCATHQPRILRAGMGLDIAYFRWVENERLLFNLSWEKTYSRGLFTATLDHLDQAYPIDDQDPTIIVGIPRSRPGSVLVWIPPYAEWSETTRLREFDSRQVPTDGAARHGSGVRRSYPPPKDGTVTNWTADQAGELAFCTTWLGGRYHLHRYLPKTDSWREVPLDLDRVTLLGSDPDNRYLWIATHSDRDGFELRRYDLDSDSTGPAVWHDPDYNFGSGRLIFSEHGDQLVGINYLQRRHVTIWFRKDYAAIQALVDKNYPNTDNVLVDRDRSERKFLFRLYGSQQPGGLALLDLDRNSLEEIATVAPWLAHRPLLPVQAISFHTRDHVRLEGYLTLPSGATAQHPVPLVVLVHDGWYRETNSFDPEVQFLASRGYAVLQPNYRGSSGYAPAISREHAFDFRLIGADVADAARALGHNPAIDPKRIAIMGSGFGGYLAIAGVTFEKDLYRCAVSSRGIFDWADFIKSKRTGEGTGVYQILSDKLAAGGPKGLENISPLAHADRISVPVLIAHGTDDYGIDVSQSKRLAEALAARKIPYETFFRPLFGQGYYGYKDRVDYYSRVEAFLAANLGGLSLTPPAK